MIRDEVGTYLYDYDCENRLTRVRRAGDWGYETGLLSVGPQMLVGPEVLAPPSAGWQHVGERFYDPATGRFLQRDPTGIEGGLNTYVYVQADPLLFIDPVGDLPLWVHRAFLAATGGNSAAGRFVDKVGRQIERDTKATRTAADLGFCATQTTVPKGQAIAGQKEKTYLLTKCPGLAPWQGRAIARGSGYVVMYEGTVATGRIGRGIIAWWYDVELD